jgi:hypothetical protein
MNRSRVISLSDVIPFKRRQRGIGDIKSLGIKTCRPDNDVEETIGCRSINNYNFNEQLHRSVLNALSLEPVHSLHDGTLNLGIDIRKNPLNEGIDLSSPNRSQTSSNTCPLTTGSEIICEVNKEGTQTPDLAFNQASSRKFARRLSVSDMLCDASKEATQTRALALYQSSSNLCPRRSSLTTVSETLCDVYLRKARKPQRML